MASVGESGSIDSVFLSGGVLGVYSCMSKEDQPCGHSVFLGRDIDINMYDSTCSRFNVRE